MTPAVIVTSSWDDGHKQDMELAALLQAHNIRGTFYVALDNKEFPPLQRLTTGEIFQLSRDFEIGAHTLTHCRLTQIGTARAWTEVAESKRRLETIIGGHVTMFCYPWGAYNQHIAQMVRDAGYRGARSVRRFEFGAPSNSFALGTSMHAYRHYSDIPHIWSFSHNRLWPTVKNLAWDHLAMRMFDHVMDHGGVFHIWGHSWEFKRDKDWRKLDNVLGYIGNIPHVQYLTNSEVIP